MPLIVSKGSCLTIATISPLLTFYSSHKLLDKRLDFKIINTVISLETIYELDKTTVT